MELVLSLSSVLEVEWEWMGRGQELCIEILQ